LVGHARSASADAQRLRWDADAWVATASETLGKLAVIISH
jgi:hypothetical protein